MSGQDKRPLGRTLVTGARGFLGEAIVRTLRAQGVPVVATDVGSQPADAEAGIRPCDVSDFAQIEGIVASENLDTILHCGGVSGPMVFADRPDLIWQINAMGTANVLEAVRRHRVPRVVICSTSDVYGYARLGVLDELAPPDPPTVYGASKVAAEQAMYGYVREHGVDAIAIRLAWIYGPGRRTATTLSTLLLNGLAGRPTRLDGHPLDMTQYFYIDDAAAGVLGAAQMPKALNRVYNISGGMGQSLELIARTVRALIPSLEVSFAAATATSPGPAGLDYARAAADFGYRPSLSFEEGVRRYYEELSRHG